MSNIIKNIFNRKNSKSLEEMKYAKEIAEFLNIKFRLYGLERKDWLGVNAYDISNNLVYLYPLNDGMLTCAFEFYKDDDLVIDNRSGYSQISNIDDILLQMVRSFNVAIDCGIVLDPYYFMLELTDDVSSDYHGNARLIITDKAIRNHKLNEKNYDKASRYFVNRFLDHFMEWNFKDYIDRNETLKKELLELNNRAVEKGIRKYAGLSSDNFYDKEYEKLQHFEMLVSKTDTKKKILIKDRHR